MINADEFARVILPKLTELQSLGQSIDVEIALIFLAGAIREVQIDAMGEPLSGAPTPDPLPDGQVGRFVQTDEGLTFDVR